MEKTVVLLHIRRDTIDLWSKVLTSQVFQSNIDADALIENFAQSLNRLGTQLFLSFESESILPKKITENLTIPYDVRPFSHEISLLKTIFLDKEIQYVYYLDSIFSLLDLDLTIKLFDIQSEYSADYSFVENVPSGICGVFFNRSLFEAMEIDQNEKSGQPDVDTSIPDSMPVPLRDYIEKNINHFHVEIHYEHPDLRILRLDYSGKTLRSIVNTMTIFSRLGNKTNYYSLLSALFSESPELLHNFPSYIEIEVSGSCEYTCTFCPRQFIENHNNQFLSPEEIRTILDFSVKGYQDTAITLGGLGEPLENKNISEIIELILSENSIPMIILETNGKYLDKVIPLLQHPSIDKLRIIININSFINYENMHGTSPASKDVVFNNIDQICFELEKLNPLLKKNIFIQTLKILENERELDEIYDYTDQKGISFLLQKYNSYIGLMPEKRVSDMTPLDRSFCWHLRRDVFIKSNGDIIYCKQDCGASHVRGNIKSSSLNEVWNTIKEDWIKNYHSIYPNSPDCAQCDEYYTFNM